MPRTRSAPRLPALWQPAELVLEDEATYVGLDITAIRPTGADVELVEFTRCRLAGVGAARLVLRRAALADCVLAGSDLANVSAEHSSMLRVELDELRLTGLQWVAGTLRDVIFRRCRMDLASFRFSALHLVEFVDCNLTRADFANTDLRSAAFVRCDLSAAQFSHAKMAGSRFTECTLDGVGGVASFAGATVSTTDLISLSRMMAGALGIVIESPGDATRA